jgi:hypothetical protein
MPPHSTFSERLQDHFRGGHVAQSLVPYALFVASTSIAQRSPIKPQQNPLPKKMIDTEKHLRIQKAG